MEAVKKLQNATKLLQKVILGGGRGWTGPTGGEIMVPSVIFSTCLSSHTRFRTT